ncbi:DNA-binding transcriptional LysR family regulator [Lactobacillus colini]|uniref:DNA-binding transcriptional LysR family regulator n=1 Tax=Lactobacillus colini TaxID=1819254 RepID=A0ABS4MF93_9LACO|nr:LysR family transcriptional regulator [Lactobacillus colini]MBP2058006.1 DNA-binding transcriptional LysR family regulator [Lactobacillus colini]
MKSNPDAVLSAKSLHYFLQLIENMSYTQTANSLGITQPALTQQVKKLERAVGAPLFIQIGKKLTLTPAGKELEQTAHRLFEVVNESVDKIQQYTDSKSGHISIGILDVIETKVIEDFLIYYHQKYPHVTISTAFYNRGNLWSKLDNGEIDLAITYLPDNSLSQDTMKGYYIKKIYSDSLVFLSSNSGDEKLNNEKWVSYPKNSYLQQVLKHYYKLNEFNNTPEVAARFLVTSQLVKFAQANKDYNAFVTNSFYQVHHREITMQPVKLNPIIYFDSNFVSKKFKLEIPRIKQFLVTWDNYLAQKDYASRLDA